MEIVLKSNVNRDEYTDYIQDHFDLSVGDVAEVHIPNNLNLSRLGDWNIGVICGASGFTSSDDLSIENMWTIITSKSSCPKSSSQRL